MWILIDTYAHDGKPQGPTLINTDRIDRVVEPLEGSPLYENGIRAMIRLVGVGPDNFDVALTKTPLNDFATSLGAQGF